MNTEILETEFGTFTNNEKTNQTAQEVYDEWLKSKNEPQKKTDIELLKNQLTYLTINQL